ncbi:hypothetical protein HDU76_012810 [Blyttiomyces sp. JEL0837]|nr:hypothetical protein HDU76_012810 [Blyttiomyces sp. JEL0837]
MMNRFAEIESSDQGSVNIRLNPGSLIDQPGIIVEVIGIVNNDLSIQEQASSRLGHNYDASAYTKMVELTTKFPEMF